LHLPPGKWHVRVLGEGALSGVVPHDAAVDVEVADGKATEPVVLTIERLGVLRGNLVGPRGEPVGRAKISRLGLERDRVADDDGTFTLNPVRFGEPFGLYASSQERSLGTMTRVTLEKGRTEPLVVTLADLVEVKGKVEDGDGQPAKQAVVVACTLFDLLGSVVVCPVESVTTDENGLFTLKLPPGKWRVEPAESEEIAPVSPQAQTEVEVTPGKPVDHVNLRVRRTVKARGVVVGLDGKPMTDATVKVDFRPQPHSSGEKGLASDGTFTVEGVVPDERFTVLAFSRDRSLGVLAEVTVRKGQTEPVTVKLATCAKITGKVVDEQGQPLISAYVRASREVSDRGRRTRFYPPLVTTQTDAQGGFTMRLPPSTGYELIADTWGYVGARIANLAAEGEKDIGTVVLKKADAFVAGKVTDANGKPVQGARVRVLSEAQPWLASSFVTTDAQGHYRIEGLAPDKVSVRAQHGQTHATREGVETGAGNVDIVLAPR